MPNIKFECPVCTSKRFYFTSFGGSLHNQPHGAVCSICGTRLTTHSCVPKLRRRRWPKQVS